jgi:hypothetical protein
MTRDVSFAPRSSPMGIWMADAGALERFLHTDPADVGCDQALAVLHVYVELVYRGEDPAQRYPGVVAHLDACGPCGEDFRGLLDAVRSHGG